MPLFEKKKTPKDLISNVCENLKIIDREKSNFGRNNEKDRKKAIEEIAKSLNQLKNMLFEQSDSKTSGKDKDSDPNKSESNRISEIIMEVSLEMTNQKMYLDLIKHLDCLEFESVKQVVELFGIIFHHKAPYDCVVKDYLLKNPNVLVALLDSYEKPSVVPHCGAILRAACRYKDLCKVVLELPEFYSLFNHAEGTAFDVSSDAFTTLRELLTTHRETVGKFLEENYDQFFENYRKLYKSENYMTQRQALKLLGELLLERHNSIVMSRFISNVDNLKDIMNLLKSGRKQLAFEAFHCFKVFVATRDRAYPVSVILYQNQQKLIDFLTNFQSERVDDGQLMAEKTYLIQQIRELQDPTLHPPPPAATAQPTPAPTQPPANNAVVLAAATENGESA